MKKQKLSNDQLRRVWEATYWDMKGCGASEEEANKEANERVERLANISWRTK